MPSRMVLHSHAGKTGAGKTGEAGIDDPGLFPHRLSFDDGLVSFLPTSAAKLRAATFLDDRGEFSTGSARLVEMAELLSGDTASPSPDRFIFHVSFCGSTLLSRLIDHPGRSMVLREPQCLADLAARRAMLDQTESTDPRVDAMLERLPALLARRWHDDEPIVIKPSNWINNLAPAICAAARPVLPVFLTTGPRMFLRAVFRGGGERVAFTARAAVHFSQAGSENAGRIAQALQGDEDQPVKLARLAALARRMQMELFAAARGWSAERCIDFEDLAAAPIETAARVAQLLDLDLPTDVIAENAARWLPRDAKRPGADYSEDARLAEDRKVDRAFGKIMDEAIAWAETA